MGITNIKPIAGNVSLVRSWAAVLALVHVCGWGLGCTNEPGALELRLTADRREWAADEPITLDAALRSNGGAVCLARDFRFEAELVAPNGRIARSGSHTVGLCGMPWLFTLPIQPFILCATLLDVADGFDRFAVVKAGGEQAGRLTVCSLQGDRSAVDTDIRHPRRFGEARTVHMEEPWPVGQYRLTIRLKNVLLDPFPAPAFWEVYDQPVEASVHVRISGPRTSTEAQRARAEPGAALRG